MTKKQQIILTHGSTTPSAEVVKGLKLGEVLVQHAEDAKAAALHTVNKEGDEEALISFPSKAYVDSQIATITDSKFQDQIDAIGGRVSTIEGDYLKAADKTELEGKVTAEATARDNADKAINDKIGDGFSASNTVADAIAAEASTREGVVNALQGDIEKKVDNETYTTKVKQIDTSINTLNDIVDGYTGKSSIKTAVDSKVAQSVYNTKVGEIEGNITAIQGTLNGLEATYVNHTELEGEIATLNASIAAAKTTIAEANPEAGIKVVKTTATEGDKNDKYEISLVGIAKQADLDAVSGNLSTVSGKVDTLIGDDTGKSARTIANEELAKQLVPEGAAEALNTLEEIAAWIQEHPGDAATMNQKITAIENNIGNGFGTGEGQKTVAKTIEDLETSLQGQINKLDETYATDDALTSAVTTLEGKITAAQKDATTTIKEGTDASNNLTITSAAGANGGTEYTISLTNVAKADDLTAEIATREADDNAIKATIGGDYSSTKTVADAIATEVKAREDADKAINDKIGDGFSASNTVADAIATEVKAREDADNGFNTRIQTLENTCIKSVVVKNKDGKVVATYAPVGNVLDLTSLVIDGGEY